MAPRPRIAHVGKRSTQEWEGDTLDSVPPGYVRARVFDDKGGKCHACTRKIAAGEKWTLEHMLAISNGGGNKESNLDLTCCNCLPEKNAKDAALKSDTAAIRAKHLGIRKPKHPLRSGNSFRRGPSNTKFINEDLNDG